MIDHLPPPIIIIVIIIKALTPQSSLLAQWLVSLKCSVHHPLILERVVRGAK